MSVQDIQDIYPLSPMQQGMLFHSLYAGPWHGHISGVYVEHTICTLRGALDVQAFRRAWTRVVERYDILRSAFVWEDVEKPLQIVFRHVDVPFQLDDWRNLGPEEQLSRLQAMQQEGLDLAQAPVMRLALYRTDARQYSGPRNLGTESYTFVWTHHHVLLDGWSVPLLFKEVLGFYEAFRQGRDLYLPPPRPYREYIAWIQGTRSVQSGELLEEPPGRLSELPPLWWSITWRPPQSKRAMRICSPLSYLQRPRRGCRS